MAEDRIDSVVDLQAVQAELDATKKGVNELVVLIQSVKGKAIDITTSKSVGEYNKLSKELSILVKQTDLAAKSAINEEKTRLQSAKATQAEAKASEALAKQKIAEIKLREATERVIEKERIAAEKLSAANISSSGVDNNVASSEAAIAATKEQEEASIELSKSLEVQREAQEELNAAMESAAASGNQRAELKVDKAPIDDAAKSVAVYKDELEKLTGTLDENEALQRLYKTELAQVQTELKLLDKTTSTADKSTQKYRNQVASLTATENRLKIESRALGTTIKNQTIEQNAAAGSIDQLRARYALLLREVERGGTVFKTTSVGKALVAEAATVKVALDKAERDVNLFRGSLSNVGSAVKGFATTAFGFIRTAANVIPGLGLSGAFLLIFEGIKGLIEMFKKADQSINEFKESQKSLNEALNEGSYQEAVKNVSELRTEIDLAKNGFIDKEGVLKHYNETIGKTTGEVKSLDEAEIALNKNAEAYIKLTLLKAAANIALTKAAAEAVKQAEAGLVTNKKLRSDAVKQPEGKQLIDEGTGLPSIIAPTAEDIGEARRDAETKIIDEAKANKEVSDKRIKSFQDIAEDFLREAGLISSQFKFDFFGDGDDDKNKGKDKKDDSLKRLQELAAQRRKAEFETTKSIQEDNIKAQEAIFKDDKQSFDNRISALREFVQEKARLIELERTFEKNEIKERLKIDLLEASKIKDAKKRSEQIKDITEVAASEIQTIEAKKQSILNELLRDGHQEYNKILETQQKEEQRLHKENADRIKKIHEDLQKDIEKGLKEANDRLREVIREREEIEKEAVNLRFQLADELSGLTFDILTAQYEKEKNLIQDQIDLLERKKQKDIEVANATITNLQDRAAAISIINDRAAAEEDILEQKKRQINIKEAQFEKAANIASIIANTAEAIVKSLDKPVLIPLIAAIGAAQLARVIATPIPRYAEGTENHKGGLAVVGDAGKPEGIKLPDGTVMKTPATSTIVDLPKGTKVYPDFNKMMLKATLTDVPVFKETTRSDKTEAAVLKMEKSVVNAIKKIPQSVTTAENIISRKIRSTTQILRSN